MKSWPGVLNLLLLKTHVVYVVYLKKKECQLFDKRLTFRHINMQVKCNVVNSCKFTQIFTENAYNNIATFTSIHVFKVRLCDRFSHAMYQFQFPYKCISFQIIKCSTQRSGRNLKYQSITRVKTRRIMNNFCFLNLFTYIAYNSSVCSNYSCVIWLLLCCKNLYGKRTISSTIRDKQVRVMF